MQKINNLILYIKSSIEPLNLTDWLGIAGFIIACLNVVYSIYERRSNKKGKIKLDIDNLAIEKESNVYRLYFNLSLTNQSRNKRKISKLGFTVNHVPVTYYDNTNTEIIGYDLEIAEPNLRQFHCTIYNKIFSRYNLLKITVTDTYDYKHSYMRVINIKTLPEADIFKYYQNEF
ncbi:hypothetical protein [Anditalea andensis]|uniref:Uncharacterized protein n=1 Tax=Anditalea andensis TaxID=1048983 RepID=A0A074LD22_9BACT|nr:hypothetical protein [Anditalea andensis]KEO71667.1 hypothetical protein EL17_23445 [Anditalea andensis]